MPYFNSMQKEAMYTQKAIIKVLIKLNPFLRDLNKLTKLVDLLEVRHLILSIDQPDRDVARHAAVAVDVGRRAVRGHCNAGRRAEVGAPDIVVEDEALCSRKRRFLLPSLKSGMSNL